MQQLLNAGNSGTPLHIMEKSSYSLWLTKQAQSVQAWLQQIDFTGEGLALMPSFSNNLRRAQFLGSSPDFQHSFR